MLRVFKQRDKDGVSVIEYAISAAKSMDGYAVMARLLKEGCVDLEDKDDCGWTPLLWAAYCGHHQMVLRLIEAGANILVADDFGRTIFHLLALNVDNIKSLKGIVATYIEKCKKQPGGGDGGRSKKDVLLASIAQIAWYDQQDHDGKTPLHWAAARGLDALVRAYVKRGSNCSIVDNDQRPPVHYACLHAQPSAILFRSLTQKLGHRAAKVAQAALSAASKPQGSHHVAAKWEEAALKKRARASYATAAAVDVQGIEKADSRDLSAVMLGGKGGSTGLHLASSQSAGAGSCGLWKELLPIPGGDIDFVFVKDTSGRTPLHYAAKFGNLQWMLRLLNLLATPKLQSRELKNPDENGWLPFHYAAHSGNIKALCLMLGYLPHNPEVDFRDSHGQTPLFLASGTCKIGAVKPLLTLAGDANAVCHEGFTPLHAAARTGAIDICERLLKAGAVADAVSNSGKSALHLACNHGSLPVLEMLLDLNADANRADAEGQTPLHLAAQGGNKNIITRLLMEGVKLNVVDNRGRTPLHDAAAPIGFAKHGRADGVELVPMVQQLLREGANPSVADKFGITPLHLCCFEGNIPAVRALLTTRAVNVNARDANHLTPADYANAVRGDCMVHAVEALAICKEFGGELTGAKFRPWKNDSDSELLRQTAAEALDEAPSFVFF